MKQGKVIILDESYIKTFSTGKTLYSLSERSRTIALAMLEYATWRTRWRNRTQEWEHLVANAIDELLTPYVPPELIPTLADCVEMPAMHNDVHYAPAAPDAPIPAGYLTTPFRQIQLDVPDVIEWLIGLFGTSWQAITGLQNGDVFTWFGCFPITANIAEALTAGLPRIHFEFSGTGQVEIHWLNVPAGGNVLISIDGSPREVIELNRDLPSLESNSITITEYEFETPGNHYIDCTFLPIVDVDQVPIRFGGGLRKIVLCGFDEIAPSEDSMKLRQKPDEPCILQQYQNGNWIDVYDFSLCPPDITIPECPECPDPCQAAPTIIYRYNITLNIYQQSDDNGATWTPCDPQPNDTPPTYEAEFDLDKWTAARRTAEHVRKLTQAWVDASLEAANIGELHRQMREQLWLLPYALENAIAPAIAILAAEFAVVNAAVLSLAMQDQATWDALACHCYCNIGDDLTYTVPQALAVMQAIEADTVFPLNPYIPRTIGIVGSTGLTNAAAYPVDITAYQATPGDCECEESGDWCHTIDFTATDGGFVWETYESTWISGAGWRTEYNAPAQGHVARIRKDWTTATTITSATIEFTWDGTPPAPGRTIAYGSFSYGQDGGSPFTVTGTANDASGIVLLIANGGYFSTVTGYITRLTVYGTGYNPFGSSNCP